MERVLVICIPYLVVDVGVPSLTVVILDPCICLSEVAIPDYRVIDIGESLSRSLIA